jgi:hypothetical protein
MKNEKQSLFLDNKELLFVKKSEMREKLLEHIEQSHLIKIERKKIDEEDYNCIPLSMGKKLVLIKNYVDFLFNGYVIIRFKDFTNVRYNDVDKFAEYILQNENQIREREPIIVSELDNWKDTFKELKKLNKYLRLERDDGEFIKYNFGEIVDVENDGITFHHFNALGEWDNKLIDIKYKDIMLVEVDDRYTRLFSKYVQKK